MQRSRQNRPILRPKSSRSKPESAESKPESAESSKHKREHVTTEEDFSLQEEGNFATEPDIKAGDPEKRFRKQAHQQKQERTHKTNPH